VDENIFDYLSPITFMGLWNPLEPGGDTSVKGYAEANPRALVLYSAKNANKGEWQANRPMGGGQATGVHLNVDWAKRTYGIRAGPFTCRPNGPNCVDRAFNSIKRYLLKAKAYAKANKLLLAHPGIPRNMGYYAGNWRDDYGWTDQRREVLNQRVLEFMRNHFMPILRPRVI